MNRIVLCFVVVISCISLLSCKSVMSDTSDALHRNNKGQYYYAWGGKDNAVCVSPCEKAPRDVEEALSGGVCTKNPRYLATSDYWYPREWNLPLNLQIVKNVKEDLDSFYSIMKDRKDTAEICLTDDILQRAKDSKTTHVSFVPYKDSREGNDIFVRKAGLSNCNSCPAPSCSRVSTDEACTSWEQRCTIKSQDMACFTNNEQPLKQYAVVKEVKLGLGYYEAIKYCRTPNGNSYVKNWNAVDLPNQYFLDLLDNRSEKIFWTSTIHGNGPVTYYTNSGYYVPNDSKEVYTVCITNVDNLNNVYIYSLDTLCP